jgi:hypothetical protein
MAKTQCQYGNDQLRRLVSERGAAEVLTDLRPEAIADPDLRKRWKDAHDLLDQLENLDA